MGPSTEYILHTQTEILSTFSCNIMFGSSFIIYFWKHLSNPLPFLTLPGWWTTSTRRRPRRAWSRPTWRSSSTTLPRRPRSWTGSASTWPTGSAATSTGPGSGSSRSGWTPWTSCSWPASLSYLKTVEALQESQDTNLHVLASESFRQFSKKVSNTPSNLI